jgi:hypothetical protein
MNFSFLLTLLSPDSEFPDGPEEGPISGGVPPPLLFPSSFSFDETFFGFFFCISGFSSSSQGRFIGPAEQFSGLDGRDVDVGCKCLIILLPSE